MHHRFTQFHPFPDGNGRVTRALVAWHLEQHDHLAIVVTRHDRTEYLDAIEADDGDLKQLVTLPTLLNGMSILRRDLDLKIHRKATRNAAPKDQNLVARFEEP